MEARANGGHTRVHVENMSSGTSQLTNKYCTRIITPSSGMASGLESSIAVFLKWGYVYPWGYSEVLQGVLEKNLI